MLWILSFLKTKRLILFACIFLSFTLLSCSPQDNAPANNNHSNTIHIPSVLAKDFTPGQLDAHYLKHKNEFGDITKEEYLNNARELLNSFPGEDVLEKIRSNGDILHYRVSTGEFAVMAKDGRIRTYFKTGYRYWLRQ